MESGLTREFPVLIIDLVGGGLGFGIAIVWWKASGRKVDRDAVLLMAKIFGGIMVLGIILAFIT
jgi:hypothetical protein